MDFDRELTRLYPFLYQFALKLSRNADYAKDLVQETMKKALENVHQFTPGTNLKAWTGVILHNKFRSDMKRQRITNRYFVRGDRQHDASVDAKAQFYAVAFAQAMEWMHELPPDQRVALAMVGMGVKYDDAARALEVPVGTVKSRVSRGRSAMRAFKPED